MDKIKEIINYFEQFDKSEEFYVGEIIRTIKRISESSDKVLLTCNNCSTKVDIDTIYRYRDFNNHNIKVEFFVCPHCGCGDTNTNVINKG